MVGADERVPQGVGSVGASVCPPMSSERRTGLQGERRPRLAAPEPLRAPPSLATGTSGEVTTLVLVVEVTNGSAGVRALTDRLQHLTGVRPDLVVCDVGVIVDPDLATVDALARLALGARRVGCGLGLRHASPELRNLLALAGLADVLPCGPESVVQVRGQPEEREELGRVQEERDPADPVA